MDTAMEHVDPVTFVLGIVPFQRSVSGCPGPAQSPQARTDEQCIATALAPLTRLLARQAARSAYAVHLAQSPVRKDH